MNESKPVESSQKEASLSAAHQLLRFLLIMVCLVGLQFAAYSVIRLSSQNYGDALGNGLIGIALIAGSLVSIKFHMSRTPCSSCPARGLGRLVVLASLPIGFFALWEYDNQRLWENLLYLSALVAIIVALLHMAKARHFAWLTFTVAPLAILCSLFVTEYEPLYGAAAYRLDSQRRPVFQAMHSDIAALVKSSDALSQLGLDGYYSNRWEYFAAVEPARANIVIFGYDQEDNLVFNPFHIEGAAPKSILAPSVSAVRYVVILKFNVPRALAFAPAAEQWVEAPLLVYKWPEKILVAETELDTGRNLSHRRFIIVSSTARRLTAFLKCEAAIASWRARESQHQKHQPTTNNGTEPIR